MEQRPWSVFERWGQPVIYERGRMVYWQEEIADCFYYLKSGKVQVFLSSENGGEKTLTIQGPGSLLGEAAFFDGLPRVSSARALVRSEILPVPIWLWKCSGTWPARSACSPIRWTT